MGPNDQYSYYYGGSNTTDQTAQSSYGGYPSRTNQYTQHNRQTSSSTPAQSYSYQQQQSGYGNDQTQPQAHAQAQTQAYSQQNYYANTRDGGQRAAETLSRIGSTTATNPGTTSNSYRTDYNSVSEFPYSTAQNQTSTYATSSSYATAAASQQPRPNSVNSARSAAAAVATRSPVVPPTQQPRANVSAQYSRTQLDGAQRSASPAQIQASHQLQRMPDQRNQETWSRPSTAQQSFVDPSAVYDPWPEYQRKLAAARAVKEAEDKALAEREAEEKRQEDEKKAAEEAEKQLRQEQETQQKKEAAARKRKERTDNADSDAPKKKRKSKAAPADGGAATAGGLNLQQLTAMAGAAPAGSDAEAHIRQLVSMVKQMNDKHPDLLAKIWEEERQQHLEKNTDTGVPRAAGGNDTLYRKKETPRNAPHGLAPPAECSTVQLQSQTLVAPAEPSQHGHPTTTPAVGLAKPPAQKANKSARGTIWPAEKKGQIAAAAVRWLNKQSSGTTLPKVTAQQIAGMLDRNPTYIELCDMIERLGFKIERATFVKALLTNVHVVNTDRSAASPAIPASTGPPQRPATPPAASSTPNGHTSSALPVRAPMSSVLPPLDKPAYISPYFDAQGDQIPTDDTVKVKKPKEGKKRKAAEKDDAMEVDSNAPSESLAPATKAEAARKRTFADLVDLIALSDDDLPPGKPSYFGAPPPVTQPGQAYSTSLDFLPHFGSHTVIDPHLQRSIPVTDRSGSAHQSTAPSFDKQQTAAMTNKLNNVELAKPINKRDALRRSRYDVRTLARDVLLATGKHPDLLPLNGHLEGLRNTFYNSINFNTDLASLRWDLIDPGEPIPEALATLTDDKDSVIDDADDESEEEVRHFDVIAPLHSRRQSIAVGAGGSPAAVMHMTPSSMDGFGRGKMVTPRSRGRPRGRPPGFARFSTGGAQTPIGNHRPPVPSSASPATGSTAGGSGGYAQFNRELRPDGTKRRGRPVGWRKHIHQRGVGVEAGGEGYVYASAKKATAPAPPPPATEPKFPVFKCGWEACTAELHNLQTLRRHVSKKHGVPDKSGKFTCLWHECGRQVQRIDTEGAVVQSIQHFDFPDTTEFMTHIEQRHIRPIAWELGDGPPGGFSDSNASDAEPYLSDRQGRRVTPTVQPAPPSSVANTSAQRQPGQRGRPPKKTDEEKARESQAALARQKREIGLGVDRGGATFANEKRRAGFVDDEDGDEILVDPSD